MSTSATGPRSDAGKQRSSDNATTHGLTSERPVLACEDPAEWDSFKADVIRDLDPATTLERELAERAALQLWRMRRVAHYEAEVTSSACNDEAADAANSFIGYDGNDPGFQAIWTILHVPTMSLPTHRGPDGLPVGIQLVARRYDDQRLLACARWVAERLASI